MGGVVPPLGVRGVAASLKPFGQIAGAVLNFGALLDVRRADFQEPPLAQGVD